MQRMGAVDTIIMDKLNIIYFLTMAVFTNIVSYNTGGLSGTNKILLKELLEDTDANICLIQETWLFNKDLDVLSCIHDDYLGCGTSAVPDNDILVGRPYVGVIFYGNAALRLK